MMSSSLPSSLFGTNTVYYMTMYTIKLVIKRLLASREVPLPCCIPCSVITLLTSLSQLDILKFYTLFTVELANIRS